MRDGGYKKIADFTQFIEAFPDEEACRAYLFSRRWPNGFACPRCGGRKHYYVSTRDLHECAYCRYQASVTAGTIMEKTHTPLKAWFWLIFLMANQKTGVSTIGAAKMVGITYKRAWFISHKIRAAMRDRDSHYKLIGLIELDESYFGAKKGGKRGRGAEGKRPVLVGVSLAEDRPVHAFMQVLERVNHLEISSGVRQTIELGSSVKTDGLGSYKKGLKGFDHEPIVLGVL